MVSTSQHQYSSKGTSTLPGLSKGMTGKTPCLPTLPTPQNPVRIGPPKPPQRPAKGSPNLTAKQKPSGQTPDLFENPGQASQKRKLERQPPAVSRYVQNSRLGLADSLNSSSLNSDTLCLRKESRGRRTTATIVSNLSPPTIKSYPKLVSNSIPTKLINSEGHQDRIIIFS